MADLKKCVFVSTELPAFCIERAQVLIVADSSWHLIAPAPFRAHALHSHIPAPEVTCAIVDIRPVPEKNDDKVKQVMDACLDKNAGVFNMTGLLSGLEALGAKVTPPPTPPHFKKRNGEGRKPTAMEVAAAFRERKDGRIASRSGARRVRVH